MTPNEKAFLDMIAASEIGPALLAKSDNGYNVLVGSTPAKPLLFSDYSAHPNILNKQMRSTAAGRYQFLARYWPYYRMLLELPDFGPQSQDRWALQLVKECRAGDLVNAGQFDAAVLKCARIWASLPGAGYGQHENSLATLRDHYVKAGGYIA